MPEDYANIAETQVRASTGVIPNLSMNGRSAEAADFYARAFAAEELTRMPDEEDPARMMHVHLRINGGSLMMTDCVAPWETAPVVPRGVNLTLVMADGEAAWDRAVAAGCIVKMPFQKMFWGDHWGLVEDPFGIEWAIDSPA